MESEKRFNQFSDAEYARNCENEGFGIGADVLSQKAEFEPRSPKSTKERVKPEPSGSTLVTVFEATLFEPAEHKYFLRTAE